MIEQVDITDLVGIPFKLRGRDLDGLDCYGLVKLIEERRGNQIPEYAYDGTEKTFVHYLIEGSMPLVTELEEPEPYCTVTISIRQPWVHHVGIVLPDTRHFIHVLRKRHVTIERLDSEVWKGKIKGYYRWKN